MNKLLILTTAALGLTAASIGFSAMAASHSNAGDVVAARKAIMKNTGASMKAGGAMLGSGAFDANLAAAIGRTIQSGTAGFPHLFPAGSFDGDTTASDKIVGDAKFNELSATLEAAGVAMASATDAASFGAGMQAAGGTCKACHSEYRVKK